MVFRYQLKQDSVETIPDRATSTTSAPRGMVAPVRLIDLADSLTSRHATRNRFKHSSSAQTIIRPASEQRPPGRRNPSTNRKSQARVRSLTRIAGQPHKPHFRSRSSHCHCAVRFSLIDDCGPLSFPDILENNVTSCEMRYLKLDFVFPPVRLTVPARPAFNALQRFPRFARRSDRHS